jgi:hypothetical protein
MSSFVGKGKQIKMLTGKILGYIREDGTATLIRKEKHYFRIYKGWGVNKELIRELKDIDTKWLEIKTEMRLLRIPFSKVLSGKYMEYKNPKDEKDYQIIIPETEFYVYE